MITIAITFLCVLAALSNHVNDSARESSLDEARFAGGTAYVDDAELKNHRDYQQWKDRFLRTPSGRALWSADCRLTVRLTMAGESAGAETTGFIFDSAGKLREARIILGAQFATRAPLNAADYPVLSSLIDNGHNINREVRAIAFLAHEFGHVGHARRIGGAAFQRQNRLLSEHETGYTRYGRGWFERPEYQRLVAELGATPFEVRRQRELAAEAAAIPVIVDYFAGKPPVTVGQAIRSYREKYPLALAVTDTQRTLASDLDAQLPKLPFADWFEKVVGPGAGITWQLSECADQQKEEPNDMRACVEASAILRDGRLVILRVAVGTFKRGRIGSPAFSFGAIGQEGELYLVRRLRDLPGQLFPWRSAKKSAIKLPAVLIPKITLIATNIPVGLLETATIEEPPPPPAIPTGENLEGASEEEPQVLASTSRELQSPPVASEGLKILGSVSWGGVISKTQPRYPPSAKRFNIAGPVDVQVTISETGRVTEAKAVSGHPLLGKAAEEAARQWVFKPAMLKGVPVETQIVLTFVFKPSQ